VESSNADFSRAYDAHASVSLRRLDDVATQLAKPLTAQFYESLARSSPIAEVLARLTPAEFAHLQASQVEYLATLISSTLTFSTHQIQARRAGRIHALVGVDIQWLVEALVIFQSGIERYLLDNVPAKEREAIERVISLRILVDLHEQVAGYRQVSRDLTAIMGEIDRVVISAANLSDLVHAILATMAGLPGEISGYFARADDEGVLQIEATFGAADEYLRAMAAGRIPYISTEPNVPSGRGPGGRAWRSGHIIVSDAWQLEPDRAPWLAVGMQLGFRSSVAVPLVDESGRTIAMLGLYSRYPGFFSTDRVSRFLNHVRHVLSHAVIERIAAPVISMSDRHEYRRMLERHRVTLHYQPIIDLRDGSLAKIEALARMQGNEPEPIMPARFLPALGDAELLALFEQVVRQACRDCHDLERDGLRTRIAINIPAQALGDTRYLNVLFGAIAEHQLPPERLALEVLETQIGAGDAARHRHFISRLREAGIAIEQDDLGAGHSSLVRLDQYPFDAVKVDQELVSGALRNPQRALEFILYLTRLAHALETPVTVEGLENVGILEAAAVLGADCGQGHAIAMPMPVAKLREWHRDYVYPVNPHTPRTALGVMAGYLLWDIERAHRTAEHFIDFNELHGSDIDRLRRHEATTAPQIIATLRDYWLERN
jgi:EAL domain-containing protein (putative c-di-GMP-specific phosphodiesterase class I)